MMTIFGNETLSGIVVNTMIDNNDDYLYRFETPDKNLFCRACSARAEGSEDGEDLVEVIALFPYDDIYTAIYAEYVTDEDGEKLAEAFYDPKNYAEYAELVKALGKKVYENYAENRDEILEKAWDELTDIPFDEEDGELVLADGWKMFDKGTPRESIWKFFDENHSKGVHYLLYERD